MTVPSARARSSTKTHVVERGGSPVSRLIKTSNTQVPSFMQHSSGEVLLGRR